MGSFIAESLREPTEADAEGISPEPLPQPEPRPEAEPPFRPDLGELLADRRAEQQSSAQAWKRPAIAAGALVVAVGLAGALLGWSGGSDQRPLQQAEPDMTIALPAAEPAKDIAALSPPPPTVAEEGPERSTAAVASPPIEREPSPPQPAVAEEQAEAGQPAETAPAEEATAQTAADTPEAQTVAAALPLPNATIARTIERIGYACGQVASTSAVEGEAPGVYKVTCTSGQSYRAAPIRGRYHFRRWGSQ
jgi:hypothetical protein